MLRQSALLTAGAIAAPKALAQGTQTITTQNPFGPMRRLDGEFWLLNRASFGFNQSDFAEVQSRGMSGWVDWQLNPQAIPDTACDAALTPYTWLNDDAPTMLNHPTMDPWEFGYGNQQVRTIRATLSKRQLHERLTEFWTDHFNVYGFEEPILKVMEDRQIIRALGMGKFRDLLQATAKGGAMLEYLDNASNSDFSPNENYAREVMELHTLGVDGPYTENDVQELARCFTGWNYVNAWVAQNVGGVYGEFKFEDWRHDNGPKTVLGTTIPAGGGVSDGEAMLDVLANHPSTARFVCGKLCRWFLGYDVPESLILKAVRTWTNTDGTIREVVRTILSPEMLEAARPWAAPKVKRPHHWLTSMLRSMDNDTFEAADLVWNTFLLGQPLFERHSPDGYPDSALIWSSRLQPRWLYSSIAGHGWWGNIGMQNSDFRALLEGRPKSEWMSFLNNRLCGGAMSDFEVHNCQRYLDIVFSSESNQAVGEAFEFVFSSPTFQTY